MLEQDGHVHVIAYASRSLNKAEQHYCVIQKECLAIVFALKQFRHYLLGRPFKLVTDHAPLQWLSAQKMESIVCRWALVMQEYSFSIEYRKGSLNSNADALSRRVYTVWSFTICCNSNDFSRLHGWPMPHSADWHNYQEASRCAKAAKQTSIRQGMEIPHPFAVTTNCGHIWLW